MRINYSKSIVSQSRDTITKKTFPQIYFGRNSRPTRLRFAFAPSNVIYGR